MPTVTSGCVQEHFKTYIQDVHFIVSISSATVTSTISHVKAVSAGNLKGSLFPPAVQPKLISQSILEAPYIPGGCR